MAELVAGHDWTATPLGAREGWPQPLRTMVDLLLTHDFPMILLWGPDLLQIYNDAYCEIMGNKHPAGLGRPTRESWPEVWSFNAPIYERVLAGETVTITDQLFPINRRGYDEEAFFTLCYSPALGANGEVGGIFITVYETTARLRQEAALEAQDVRYKTLFDSIDEGFGVIEMIFDEAGGPVDYRFVDANPAFSRHTGIKDPVGRTALEAVPGLERFWFETYGRVATTREPARFRHGSVPMGKAFEVYAFPFDETQRGRVGLLFTDISDRARAEEALRESEERFRLIVESARDYAIFTTDADGLITDWHKGAQQVFGWTAEEAIGQPAEMTFTPEDRESGVPQDERRVAAAEGSAPNVRWHLRKDGSRVFIDGAMMALRGADSSAQGFLKIGRDMTDRQAADQRQRTLLAELQHRVRNTLAVVRSIARRTADQSGTVDEMSSHLQGRLDAFSRVQSAVTRNPDAGVDLTSIVEDELLAHAAREGRHLKINGPELGLKPKAAETLSLAVHELATNAVKYGALSDEAGSLSVTWKREQAEGADRLKLLWEEAGLPEALPGEPERQGFGMELLTRTLPYELRADVSVEFRPQGLRFALEMPLGSDVLADDQ